MDLLLKCQILYAFLTDNAINSNKALSNEMFKISVSFLLDETFEIHKLLVSLYLKLGMLYLRRVELFDILSVGSFIMSPHSLEAK